MDKYPNLDRFILRKLLQELTDCNLFIDLYKTACERLRECLASEYQIVLNPQIRLVIQTSADRQRENLPTSNEVAVILSDEFEGALKRDIILACRNRNGQDTCLTRINVTHALYMPLHYVLLFPCGDYRWHYGLKLCKHRNRACLSQRQFYQYRLHTHKGEFSPLFYAAQLFQQYYVDAFAAYNATALDWLRNYQKNLYAEVYRGLQDYLIKADVNLNKLGRRVVLLLSFTGEDCAIQQYYYNSMAIVRKFRRPSIFLTMTANPNWPEILQNLLPSQQPKDWPDLIACVFHLKVKELLRLIKKDRVFGLYQANMYIIKYQKRGLLHIHILIWFKSTAQFLTAERID
jgi:hypothetical protein